LVFRDSILHAAGQRIGDALVEQGLLPFKQELLIAQRAHGQPGQDQAGHEHREHKNQRDFFHSSILRQFTTPGTGWRRVSSLKLRCFCQPGRGQQ
jgi:hypothetical protein